MKNVMVKAWEIAREGQRKFGGKVKEYFAEALRLAWIIVKNGMEAVKLVGSEKQVKWAESIRSKFVNELEEALQNVKSNNAKKVVGSLGNVGGIKGKRILELEDYKIFPTDEKFEETVELVRSYVKAALSIESAQFFIRNQKDLVLAISKECNLKFAIMKFLKANNMIKSGTLVY